MSYSVPALYKYNNNPVLRQAYWGDRMEARMENHAESFSRDIARLGAVTVETGASVAASNRSAIMEAQGRNAEVMRENAALERQTMREGFSGVARAIGNMSADMSLALARLDDAVRQSAQLICDRLDKINGTLDNPTFTRARELYRRAVTSFGKGFYEEARDDLLESTAMYKIDYIAWFLLGKVYLFGAGEFSVVVDMDAAIKTLATALKYITPDAREHSEVQAMASEVCFYLGLARLYKSNVLSLEEGESGGGEAARYLDEAQQAFDRAWHYSGKNLEARFLAAWCKAQPQDKIGPSARDEGGALADMEAVISEDAAYIVEAVQDGGFAAIAEGFNAIIERIGAALVPTAKSAVEGYHALMKHALAS